MGSPASGRLAAAALVALTTVCIACSGPILAVPPAARPVPIAASPAPSLPPDPVPVELPRDDGPHHRLTEWWYYTGHLVDESGSRFGFEYVVFRAERGAFPVSWASHLAITDEAGKRFLYAQRSQVGPAADISPAGDGRPSGFAFSIAADGSSSDGPGQPSWEMSGVGGSDRLAAAMSPAEVAMTGSVGAIGLDLDLNTDRPAVLHDGDGWIDFGPAGGSYYYSRTRMTARGTLTIDGAAHPVGGTAWFDHQWGDFIAVGGGGWDWFAIGLDDGTDLMISQVRDASGAYPLVYGTLVDADGAAHQLPASAFAVAVTDRWTSDRTGADYPAGWRIEVPGRQLYVELRPTVADQELDTRSTTGVVYWEGSQVVRATLDGRPVGGEAYVELTGYAND